MKIPKEIALGAVRFSLGKYNTEEEINYVVKKIEKIKKLLEVKTWEK